ncbi:MAG: glycerophosphodiester phosphodiesterase [Clostridiales bacterium]|nr:glycerophosphodiester phosphodiesterase [Clostridiales bacterium]
MFKQSKLLIPFAAVAGTSAALVCLTKPAKATKEQKAPFVGRNFAHRGLFSPDQFIPENSLSAFELAADSGYGIELDVRLTADDRIVVFHDDSLERVCDVEGSIEDSTWAQLKKLPLYESDEYIPLLSDVLNVVGGRSPIIIEIKPTKRKYELCERLMEFIRSYNGEICVQSFDPKILSWFKKNAPDVLRGQLSQPAGDFGPDVSSVKAFAVGNLLTNFISRPHFVSYKIGKRPPLVKLCYVLGAMKVAFTAHDPSPEGANDAVIFEHFTPAPKYK